MKLATSKPSVYGVPLLQKRPPDVPTKRPLGPPVESYFSNACFAPSASALWKAA